MRALNSSTVSVADFTRKRRPCEAYRCRLVQSHANIVSTDSVFRIADSGDVINAPFFDIEDDYFVKTDLWLASAIALDLMDLFYGVNKGRNVIGFMDDFPAYLKQFESDTAALRAEMMATDRFKRAMAKANAAKS